MSESLQHTCTFVHPCEVVQKGRKCWQPIKWNPAILKIFVWRGNLVNWTECVSATGCMHPTVVKASEVVLTLHSPPHYLLWWCYSFAFWNWNIMLHLTCHCMGHMSSQKSYKLFEKQCVGSFFCVNVISVCFLHVLCTAHQTFAMMMLFIYFLKLKHYAAPNLSLHEAYEQSEVI